MGTYKGGIESSGCDIGTNDDRRIPGYEGIPILFSCLDIENECKD